MRDAGREGQLGATEGTKHRESSCVGSKYRNEGKGRVGIDKQKKQCIVHPPTAVFCHFIVIFHYKKTFCCCSGAVFTQNNTIFSLLRLFFQYCLRLDSVKLILLSAVYNPACKLPIPLCESTLKLRTKSFRFLRGAVCLLSDLI